MSAIFGLIHLDETSVSEEQLLTMQEVIAHYGRDGQEIYTDRNAGLGCCLHKLGRYSENDSPVYKEPSGDAVLVGDALIYNRDEVLRACGLKDENPTTQELLMAACRRWGAACPRHLNGDFTFAVWEKEQKRLLLFRDHLGVRPLYYSQNRSSFAFATDYRALLVLPFVGKQLDDIMLYAALSDTYHMDTHSTFFSRVKRLPQAHVMQVRGREVTSKKYWAPGEVCRAEYQNEEQCAREMYHLVKDSISLRLQQVRAEIASEFSGGLDSSVVTVMAQQELKKENRSLTAYSWSPSFKLQEKLEKDERDLINAIGAGEGFPCNFKNRILTAEEEIESRPALTNGQRSEELRPVLQEIASQGSGAVLSGWGGDEGISHRADLAELLLGGCIRQFLQEIRYLAGGSVLRFIKLLIAVPLQLLLRPYSLLGRQNKSIPCILDRRFERRTKKRCKRDILYLKVNPAKHMESGASVSRTEIAAWLGADYQLQYLFPFLDYRVVDYALSIPRHYYYKKGLSRYIYRKAFEHILPRELCYNTGKIDIAREAYWKRTEDFHEKAEAVMKRIDKGQFSDYVDWAKLEELVARGYFKENTRESLFTLFKLQTLYDIQKLLEDIDQIDRSSRKLSETSYEQPVKDTTA